MSKTYSSMVSLGTQLPSFTLLEPLRQKEISSIELEGKKGTLVIFICNHCPYVHHVIDELVMIAHDYRVQGLGIIAINSNDVNAYPEDHPEKMVDFILENRIPFPYLFDETQKIARIFDAQCTPDFFLFDARKKLIYRGQLDDSRPSNGIPVSGTDLRGAIDSLLLNRSMNPIQKPSMGCNIKWKE